VLIALGTEHLINDFSGSLHHLLLPVWNVPQDGSYLFGGQDCIWAFGKSLAGMRY
jgi:hypothetical protein